MSKSIIETLVECNNNPASEANIFKAKVKEKAIEPKVKTKVQPARKEKGQDDNESNILEVNAPASVKEKPLTVRFFGEGLIPDGVNFVASIGDAQMYSTQADLVQQICRTLKVEALDANGEMKTSDVKLYNANFRVNTYEPCGKTEDSEGLYREVQYRFRPTTSNFIPRFKIKYTGRVKLSDKELFIKNPEMMSSGLRERLEKLKTSAKYDYTSYEPLTLKICKDGKDESLFSEVKAELESLESKQGRWLRPLLEQYEKDKAECGFSMKSIEPLLDLVLKRLYERSNEIDEPNDNRPKLFGHVYYEEDSCKENLKHNDGTGTMKMKGQTGSKARRVLEKVFDNENYVMLTQHGHRAFEMYMIMCGLFLSGEWEHRANIHWARNLFYVMSTFTGIGKSSIPATLIPHSKYTKSANDEFTQADLIGMPLVTYDDISDKQLVGSASSIISQTINDVCINERKMNVAARIVNLRLMNLITANREPKKEVRDRLNESRLLEQKCIYIEFSQRTSIKTNPEKTWEQLIRENSDIEYEDIMHNQEDLDKFASECYRLYKANDDIFGAYVGDAMKTANVTRYEKSFIDYLLDEKETIEKAYSLKVTQPNITLSKLFYHTLECTQMEYRQITYNNIFNKLSDCPVLKQGKDWGSTKKFGRVKVCKDLCIESTGPNDIGLNVESIYEAYMKALEETKE